MRFNKRGRAQLNEWILTLYGEQYPQTTGVLQDKRGYCCFGVACNLLIPEKKLNLRSGFIYGFGPEDQASPKWLENIDQDFFRKAKIHLIELNDGTHMYDIDSEETQFSFQEIAMLLDLVYNYKILD